MCNTVIQRYLSKHGVQKILVERQNKIEYLEVMYRKAFNYYKSKRRVTQRIIVMEYLHSIAKVDFVCSYFWRLEEFM